MADVSHLERMGRELKCPICLSLLSSAVSLSCNHVFCSKCVEKSMKTSSSCPVCKVPYRRREIRPAPHMDNLVSVYKSMEVASGVNIFVTQNAASTKQSVEDSQPGVGMYEDQHNEQTKVEAVDSGSKKRHQRKGSKRTSVTAQRSSGSNLLKPSFPTKKRVQVPHYTDSGTEMEHENLEAGIGDIDKTESKKCPVSQKEKSLACEQQDPVFSPFFWLRDEEDLEKLSQQTEEDMYTPPEAPCFSDIKDSDDEVQCQENPEKGTCILSSNADFIDSEMFDWTQIPCSPELCSSPLALQIDHTTAENKAPKETDTTLRETAGIRPNNRKGNVKRRKMGKTPENEGGIRKSSKKVTVARKNKRAKITCDTTEVDTELGRVTDKDVQEGVRDSPLNLKGRSIKSKKILSDASVQEKDVTLSDGTDPLANWNTTSVNLASEDLGKSSEGCKNSKKSAKKTLTPQKFGSPVNTHNLVTEKGCLSTEQEYEDLISRSHTNLTSLGNGKEVSVRRIKRTCKEKSKKQLNSRKKVKFSVEGMPKDNGDAMSSGANDESRTSNQPFQEIQGARDQLRMEVPEKVDKSISSLNSCVLLKCNASPSSVCCAFCQSSEESEASGIMVHYLNGNLVAHDHNAKKNAIHVHKNCAEWAPNVYFEDDNPVNLGTEISRSRRIRCCCCGIKGAALGCYEKSCRKSFHVPCARLTPECRWDNENFVILCPIHTSSKLPNEMPQSQSSQKRKSSAERNSRIHQDPVKTTEACVTHSNSQWKSQKKFKNLVFCYSALTHTEKETVAEFERLSGMTALKKWEPNVTHVIASTDENGACRRTLKFLMGILEGKWIISVQWIKACIEAGELVDEQQYEVSVDIHGIRDGPKLGRLRLLNKQPKLFDGYNFYFMGDFTPSYKGYLHDLVVAAGGKVLNRKPVAENQAIALNRCSPTTLVIYSIELPEQCRPSDVSSVLNHRRAQAEALALSAGAVIATNLWIMNSVAGYKVQKIGE